MLSTLPAILAMDSVDHAGSA